jgi:hypothetical protein
MCYSFTPVIARSEATKQSRKKLNTKTKKLKEGHEILCNVREFLCVLRVKKLWVASSLRSSQ